jgi:uncharacterized membrane protein
MAFERGNPGAILSTEMAGPSGPGKISPIVRKLLNYFIRGLIVVTPLAVTIWICVMIFQWIDDLLGFPIPGTGFVIMIVLVTMVGFLASTLVARGLGGVFDRLLARLPFVSLLYSSTKDMLNAFVGEKRRFDKPVLVSLSQDGATKLVGFLTAESLTSLGAAEHVTVYIPLSYGVAGHIILVRSDRVHRIDADAANVMAYILSGGVTEVDVRT